ncbi:MAG TPA: flagellar basal body rod protein FlgC [Sphingomicrobium sp.]|nr:flagellar basal body rod protein FlgC [Sphingomicrobium sp.]
MEASAISRTALDVEWQRLQVIANNLANANTTRTAEGGAYRPLRLVSGPSASFSSLLRSTSHTPLSGVQVYGVEPVAGNVRRVYDPKHPHADADGFVTYPEIDRASEMTLMIQTSRAYEANLVALNLAHQMYAKALELGRQS